MPDGYRGERVAVLISLQVTDRIFSTADSERIAALGARRLPAVDDSGNPDLSAVGPATEVIVTGWGTPRLTEAVLARAPRLRLIAHTGGSIRAIVPVEVYARGITVTTVSHVLAEGVAEYTVMAVIAGARRLSHFERAMRNGMPWEQLTAKRPGRLLRALTVGLVGASRVGRAVLPLLQPFGCRILLADPFISDTDAAELGADRVELTDLLRESDIVSLHAPVLAETRGMIGAEQLASLRDGAVLVNTARAALVDNDALLAELTSGRIQAVLDVFEDEPLGVASPWRSLDAAIATPHVAALTADTLHEQGRTVLDEILRHRAGERLVGEITPDMYDQIA